MRQAIALQMHFVLVERRAQVGCHVGAAALGHGQQQHAAVGARQQPGQGHRPTGAQGGGEIETAEQGAVAGVVRHAQPGRGGGQQGFGQGQPVSAQLAGRRSQRHAAQTHRVHREQRRGQHRVGRQRGTLADVHAGSSSATARSTRVDEPALSSGLRRRRWRRAGAAMRRMWWSATALSPSSAASARAARKQGEVAAQAVGAQGGAQAGDALAHRVAHAHRGQALAGRDDLFADALVVGLPLRDEGAAVLLKRVAPLDDFHPVGQLVGRFHLDRQAKAVQQLGPQLAFFRVAAAHQHKARRVAHRQAFALDHVFARGGHVDQQVDQVVFQQVDLVDVEKAAVRLGQQAGLKRLHALRQGALQIQRTDHAVFGGAQRQVDHGHRNEVGLGRAARGPQRGAFGAAASGLGRIAAVAAALHRFHLGQQRGQGAHRGRFAGAPVAQHQNAADAGVDGGNQDRRLHLFLADDGRKGECLCHKLLKVGEFSMAQAAAIPEFVTV